MSSVSPGDLMPVVDYLMYKSYEYNRINNPDISVERWGRIYPQVNILEEKFKEQKSLEGK